MKNFTAKFAGAATLALAVLPMAALTTAAHAQPAKVYVGDLNLATASGQKAATVRVDRLSHELCADERGIAQRDACQSGVMHEGREQIAAAAAATQFASASTKGL